MIVVGIVENYWDEVTGTDTRALQTNGCGCCAQYLPLTKENIDSAIESTAKLLVALNEERKKLEK